jgi:hypothetical protein
VPQLARSCDVYRRTGRPTLSPSIEPPAAVSAKMRVVRRLPLLTLVTVVTSIVAVLAADRHVERGGQLGLGVLTALVLAVLLVFQPRTVRLQTLAVVGFATIGEVIGSLVWGLYGYRLHNLPAFVPPGHGLVYLAGLSLATLLTRRSSGLLLAAGVVAVTWGVAGITVLPTPDASGTMGCAFLLAVLLVTRRTVYAGVFVVVVALELYGTAIGTWAWQPVVPGLGLTQGNPPSGVASGYVVFDVLALALVPQAGSALALIQSRRPRKVFASTAEPARMSSRAESTLSHTSQSRNPRALPSPST